MLSAHTFDMKEEGNIICTPQKEEYQMLLTGSPAIHLGQYCPAPRPGAGNTCWQNQTHSDKDLQIDTCP